MSDARDFIGPPSNDATTSAGWVGLSGQTVSHYQILERLGEGGMGVVYKARDAKLDRIVALKFLPAYLKDDPELKRRLVQEARAASALDHPNIVVIHDVDVTPDGALFVAMAFHDGETLQARIRSGLSMREAVDIGRQIALGLAKAHGHGVFHRDIKPSNVIVAKDGVARIIDFGLAKPLDATATIDGAIRGTPLYMSPEQATGGVVDRRTDLWSLGAVIYEMLTGRRPFEGGTNVEIMQAIAARAPETIASVRSDVPASLAAIVGRALEKDPAKRYQSAEEMARDLSDVLASLSAPVMPVEPARRTWRMPAFAAAAVVVAAAAGWYFVQSEHRHWAREQAVPEIAKLRREDKPLAAFLLLQQAKRYLPDDPALATLADEFTGPETIRSDPEGATAAIQDYVTPDGPWLTIGTTPIEKSVLPRGYFHWRVSKPGVATYDGALPAVPESPVVNVSLTSLAQAPDGMVSIGAARFNHIVGFLGWIGPYDLPAFDIGRYEVTNRQFQQFVDKGGYQHPELWKDAFVLDGHALAFADAIARLHDSTGRPGPSVWRAGHYPEGQADFPVSGVSWYEAAAYANFAGQSLPAIAQWYEAAPSGVAQYITRLSNLEATSPAAVGQFKGLGPFGTFDMAGNVREWCANQQTRSDRRFALGGGYSASRYLYGVPETLPPFDRSEDNGFRLVRNRAEVPSAALASQDLYRRDATQFVPASEDVFRVYRSLYSYEPAPLKATIERTEETADWRKEKVSYAATYGQERVPAFLFLPTHVQPPYQAVVFFPSAGVLGLPSSDPLGDMRFVDYVIQSGRAVIYPVYQHTYERLPPEARAERPSVSEGRQVLIDRVKDASRAVDYLESRADIDKTKIAYLGVSMGSAYGVMVGAIEQRFKAIVWLEGGLFLGPPAPGMDQVDFAPRVTKPLLMVNGKYDFVFSPEAAQTPLFRLVGTPAADKRQVALETAHDLSNARPELIREVTAWLDRYLGRIQ